ncbi:major capsid protein [Actinomycetospora aeridis]|uniref:Major capsid protein n=1 Tax=Actinomycetospora aeridis TaxID=3129231 RepID=A0ABU8N2I2_9PSEU
MALTLSESAVLSQTTLARGVQETFVQESVVLDRLPLMTIQGNSFTYTKESTLPGVAFRGVNEAYTESTGTFVQASESLVILGGDADVDRFIVQTRGNLNDQRALQTRAKIKSASYKFQNEFINGDITVDTKGFDGLKKRLAGGQVIDAATNGLGPVAGGHDFFDKLDELFGAVQGGPDVAYANSAIIAKILSAGRRLGGADIVNADAGGKRAVTWNGVPILDLGTTAAGTAIIPRTETQGTASGVASSIYAVKFGQDEADQAVTGLTNGGVQAYDLGEVSDKPVYRTRLEFYCGLATFGGKAAARLRGVLNA